MLDGARFERGRSVFVGHIGAGMAVKPLGRELNLGFLVFCALLLDLLLWVFVLAGVEQVVVPPDFSRHPFLSFVFPYSHSLVSSVTWAAAAAGVTWKWARKAERTPWYPMLAAGLAVLSHFWLDGLVHVKDLPLDRDSSIYVGTGLWEKNMAAAVVLELVLAAAGAAVYWKSVAPRGGRRFLLVATLVLCSGLTVAGATLQKVPPSPSAAAWSGIVAILLVSLAAGWADRGGAPAGTP